jgi:periplasmic divalent cation tolerance protein
MAEECIQVFTTTETRGAAEKIAKTLIERRLAACAQIFGPLSSIYWWKGKLENAEEWGCLFKSTHVLYHELEDELRQMHPYENPEIIVMPIVGGSKTYLDWIRGETMRPS